MIYQFEILAPNGLFEGWAHNKEEMLQKFQAQHPDASGKETPYVFLAGGAPKWLNYAEYGRLHDVEGLSDAAISILDNRLGALYDDLESDLIESMVGGEGR